MKLPIKKRYFDEIKAGTKTKELRDAHITFVCEETGETLRKDVLSARVEWFQVRASHTDLPWEDDYTLVFELGERKKRGGP